jgi:3-dehydroquinate synthase
MEIVVHPIIVLAGEQAKTLETYSTVVGACADIGLDKESTVISFGGGVVKDLARFPASTLYRGVNFVHIPTTVLAQVDAAIGWKQAINLSQEKNLVGSMYSLREIWVNARFLHTLDDRWIRDGLSESVKVALCRSSTFLNLLAEANTSSTDWLVRVVDISISLKLGL